VYQTEKNLKEYKDRIDASDVAKLESDVEAVKAALKSEHTSEMKSATEKLNATWQEVAQRMYQQASPPPGAAEGAGSAASGSAETGKGDGPGGDVADAEYEVLDGDKKKS
jgi:molecular chaperone DnaK